MPLALSQICSRSELEEPNVIDINDTEDNVTFEQNAIQITTADAEVQVMSGDIVVGTICISN